MSFYPRLLEKIDKLNTVGSIRNKILAEFPEKYSIHSKDTRLKNKGVVTIDELVNDFKEVIKKYNINVDPTTIKILEPKEGEEGLDISSKFKSISFNLNGTEKNLVFSDSNYRGKTTRTTTEFKEGLAIFFFETDDIDNQYKPFNIKDKNEAEYKKLLGLLIKDIGTKGIKGVEQSEIDSIVAELAKDIANFNEKILLSIFNAMAVGKKLKTTEYKDWIPYRNNALFKKIKEEAATSLGFTKKEVDKWCPMDFILVKPGQESKVLETWNKAKEKQTEEFKIGDYNSIFVEDLKSYDDSKIILGISLKESKSQAGWGKGYLRKSETVKDKYDLTKEELTWDNNRFLQGIIDERKKVDINISQIKEAHLYKYAKEDPIDGFKKVNSAKIKYASLKLLNYLLTKVSQDNLFINGLLSYSMGLGKNPTFFIFTGDDTGNPEKVDITKREQNGGVSIYNISNKNIDGRILIKDSNSATGIEITYFAKICGELNKIRVYIRKPTTMSSNVSVAIMKPEKMDTITESYYPRINEKFTEESDPIYDMGIGIVKKIAEWFDKNIEIEQNDDQNYKSPYVIRKDGTIDVHGNLAGKIDVHIDQLPSYITFNIVDGWCDFGHQGLTSLRGFPKEVHGYFRCSDNKLMSLEGCPKIVTRGRGRTGNFYAGGNPGKFTNAKVRKYCKQIDGRIDLEP